MSELESGRKISIVAIDPGQTTGFCSVKGTFEGSTKDFWRTADVHLDQFLARTAHQEWEVASYVLKQCELHKASVLIIEDFILRSGGSSERSGLSPVRITSSVTSLLYERQQALRLRLVLQTPAQAKSVVTNERLRKLGLWERGMSKTPHAVDALRHAVLWMKGFRG